MSHAATSPRARPGRSHLAFTLMEVVLSMAIVTVALGACLSVTTLMARSAQAGTDAGYAGQNVSCRAVLDQVADDLKLATAITEHTATAVTVVVPDRNGDGSDETIRYAWAGPGLPLTRQYNGGTAVTVMPSAQSFALAYADRTVAPPPPTVSGEQLLFSYDDPTATSKFGTNNANWAAQWFKPTLPGGALSWAITRVRVQAQRANTNVFYSVEVRAIDASNKPTGAALASVSFNSSTLATTPTWLDLSFPTAASNLNPANGYAIIVRGTNSGTKAISTNYDSSSLASSSRGWTTSNSTGSTWTAPISTRAMQMYVYGTVTTP